MQRQPDRPLKTQGRRLERLDVRRLPTLGPLDHVELHSLTFLKALETVRIDRRVMYENILAVLTADEAKPLGVVKPLYCSLFHFVDFLSTDEFPLDPNRGSTLRRRLKPICFKRWSKVSIVGKDSRHNSSKLSFLHKK